MSPHKPPPRAPRTEAEFLAQEREDARLATRQTLRDLGESLETLAKEHPLITLGGAAVAGALAARLITPSTRREHVAPPPPAAAGGLSLVAMIENSVLDIIKGFVVAALAAHQSTASPKHDGESNLT
jgi:hypothetical protein